MRRIVLAPLIFAAIALASLSCARNSDQGSREISEFCLKANDFAGCVETMKRGLDSKRKTDVREGLRTWTRDTGVIVRMRTDSVKAVSPKGEYGRYLEWTYSRTGEGNESGSSWSVQGDCQDFTVNWEADSMGWTSVKSPEEFLKKRFPFPSPQWGEKMSPLFSPAKEAQDVLSEFCPQMDRLIREANEE